MKKLLLAVFLMFTVLSYAGYESNIKAKISKLERQSQVEIDRSNSYAEMGDIREEFNNMLDEEMTKVYNLIMKKKSKSEQTAFRNKQRQWLKKRKQYVENSAEGMGGGGAGNIELAAYADITKKRLYEFARMYDKMKK